MNKKRFLLFLLILIFIILIPVLYFLFRQPKAEATLLSVSSKEEVNQFYYRAVPGLKLAEEADLVQDVNKQLEIPGQNATLIIDRIWYNVKQVIIFYHVEGVSDAVCLGGELYLPEDEPIEKQSFYGSKSIGGNTEKGILYNESFYSCLQLPPLLDSSGHVISEIETLMYTPYINIPDEENGIESVAMKQFDIWLNFQQEEEAITKIPLDSQIDMDDKYLRFYQIDLSPSVVRLYFQYLNSGRDQVYRVSGSYTTDKGETQTFDVFPETITDYPYHYTLEIPSFHILPETIQLQIDSIFCIGNDSVSFELETNQFSHRNRSNETEIGKNRIRGTEVFIRNITLNNHFSEIHISFVQDEDVAKSFNRLYPLLPQWAQEEGLINNAPNYLTIRDSDFQLFNLDELNYGSDSLHGEEICIRLDRKFWNETDRIDIRLENLTYLYQINKSAHLTLQYQESLNE